MQLRAALVLLTACSAPHAPAQPAPRLELTSAPELFAPGVVSSEHTEIRLAVSPDGNTVLWGSTDRLGGAGHWDIWSSRKTGGTWSAPAAVAFNSDANDFDPAYSPDGRWVYFFSNRDGGAGGDDIYRAAVTADGFASVPEHLGPEINTAGDEWAPAPSPDGTQLLFASNQPGHKHDLFVAELRGTGFAPARPLPGAVNTADSDEFDATWLGNDAIVFSRSRDVENDPIALVFSARGATGFDAGTPLAAINVTGGASLGPAVHGDTLYFSSKRADASAGKLDIYRVRYKLTSR